ncbi:MAG: glycoside hydrolase TIM-barrel-like domain-containing protein [Rhizobiaceae bacterium]|nr:glycoside hydrolase TIM-barrel-like domain-containing protein [Rhizobiaceae bacterium]
MATILLQAAGVAIGGALGPIGAAVGSAVGALAGYAIDTAIINGMQRIEGPRLSGARPFSAEEGVAIPRVYGVARMGGLVIWATRFEEARETSRQGMKGPRVTEYSYFANLAFALCEGEIAGVRRIWADGKELDQTLHEIRVHRGTEAQEPDPLIEARQGAGNAPAYRGTAYVVFERFPLAEYGNRIPQLQFEVLRPVGEFHRRVKGVALIPGATEYGLSPTLVTREIKPGETQALNRHVLCGATDFAAALDELQMLCPNLEHIALVASWFGDDLRAGECRIRPMVTDNTSTGFSAPWVVSGLARESALQVSYYDGGAAYGGTPSDRTIIDAIAAIRARGLKVTLYPFIMMDVPPENTLPDPHGGTAQAPYPWRGRISCFPGPRQPGSADKTAAARAQVEAFCGVAAAGDFAPSPEEGATTTIAFNGAAEEWSYRRFLLHFAHLAAAAGGVDTFLIGTELRGLTTLRDEANAFPFVEALCQLGDEVRGILGPATKLTYGADWSEYFGHQPPDGTGDAFFHLDPLWAHPEIAAIGIDNYMPLSDWRDADHGGGNADGFETPCDIDGMMAAIAGGEGFDWYYPDEAARAARERAPITDGSGKPWVYRYKDLVNWWSNPHFDRIGGVEVSTPTAWTPRSKPIWFTELGCPAVDKGPNQPNVFPDPKSSESASPYFSSGGRSDIAQRNFLEAHQRYWDPSLPGFEDARNPLAPGGFLMLDHTRTLLWAWDARPFPAFPLRSDEWRDGGNWHLGHWLNGRLESSSCSDLINRILADHGVEEADTRHAEGMVQGYVLQDPTTARAALEPITDLFGIMAVEEPDRIVFRLEGSGSGGAMPVEDIALTDDAALEIQRVPDHELPREAILTLRELFLEFQATSPRSRRLGAMGSRQQAVNFPGTVEFGQAQSLLDDWMKRVWTERERVTFSVSPADVGLEPGTVIRLPNAGLSSDFIVTGIEEGLLRTVSAKQIARGVPAPWRGAGFAAGTIVQPILAGKPDAHLLDLPMMAEEAAPETRLRVAAWQKPWRSQSVYASGDTSGFTARTVLTMAAIIGRLTAPLPTGGFEGRIDRRTEVFVALSSGELSSVSRLQLLNGANMAAVESAGGWEILQFEEAEEIAPDSWRLRKLLRGQFGTNDAANAGTAAGAVFVLLDQAVVAAGLAAAEVGLERNWRIGPSGYDITPANFVELTRTGGVRAQLPLSPVHLGAKPDGAGGLLISWVRRGRINADDWQQAEIPLGEALEEYEIRIAAAGGGVVRTATSPASQLIYTAADIAADFGAMPAAIKVTVRQRSAAIGWGIPATRRIAVI